MIHALKIIGLIVGTLSTGFGLLIWFGLADNSDAQGLAQFVALPFLALGLILLFASVLALVL